MPVVITGGVLSGIVSLYLSWMVFERWNWMHPILRVGTSIVCWAALWALSFAAAVFVLWPAA